MLSAVFCLAFLALAIRSFAAEPKPAFNEKAVADFYKGKTVRIVVPSLLAIHVDPSFITGSVTHRYSGIVLFAVSFAILGGIIWTLQWSERTLGHRSTTGAG